MLRYLPYAAYEAAVAYGLLLLCIVLQPAGLSVNNGFSYYGIYGLTLIPYAIALVTYSLVFWQIAHEFKDYMRGFFYKAFRLLPLLLIGILLTPYTRFELIHNLLAASLFFCQLLISFLIVRIIFSDKITTALLTIQFISGFFALYFMEKPEGWVLQSQAIFQVAFMGILLRIIWLSGDDFNRGEKEQTMVQRLLRGIYEKYQ